MFEGWASDLLASYLGQFLEVQREQLRVSLWSAWRTGLTLENVALRTDAFDHLQLPLKLQHGRVGRVTAQVPWRALSSPVVLELFDLEVCFRLLSPADLAPAAAAARAAAAKQALVASEELQALAGSLGPEGPKQGGMLLSLLQHALAMLLRRLQLTVVNVRIRIEDPVSGRSFGLVLGQLRTCAPGEEACTSLLLSSSTVVGEPSFAAAKGSIQKQFSAEGIQAYWVPRGADPNEDAAEGDWDLLKPTTVVMELSTAVATAARRTAQVHVAAVVHSLPLQVRSSQVADIMACVDEVQWLTARAKYAHLRQATSLGAGEGMDWKAMWRYAVDAVLQDFRGPQRAARWQALDATQHSRRRYVLLYRKKLELEREAAAAPRSRRTGSTEAEPPVPEPLQGVSNGGGPLGSPVASPSRPSSANSNNLSPIGEQQLLELEQELSVADIVTCRTAARQALEGALGSRPQSSGGDQSAVARRGISWGIAKAASLVGFVPAALPGGTPLPSESEVQELYEAVDFNPEEATGTAQNEAAAEVAEVPPSGLHITMGCLITTLSINLLDSSGVKQAAVELERLEVEVDAGGDGTVLGVTLSNVVAQDWVSHGPGVVGRLLERCAAPDAGDGPPLPPQLPLVRMQLAASKSTLDLLVQPLRLHAGVPCLRALGAFVPVPGLDSFGATCMRATNALSTEARAALKAQHIRQLGRCIDLVFKLVDLEVVIPSANSRPEQQLRSGTQVATLRTGALIVHSVGQAEITADASRVFGVLDRLLEVSRGNGHSTTAREELTAAAAAVEERLVYQHLEFSAAGIEFFCPPDPSGSQPEHAVLHPMKLSGSLKLHRITEDYGLPQVVCALHVGPMVLALTPTFIQRMSQALATATPAPANGLPSPTHAAPHPHTSPQDLGPKQAVLDLHLARADVTYSADLAAAGTIESEHGADGGLPPSLTHPSLHYRLSLRSSSVALTAYAGGVAARVNLGGLSVRDVGAEAGFSLVPGVTGEVPRLASRLCVEAAHITVSPAERAGEESSVEVQLMDLSAVGFEGEPGNFISRVHEHQPTHITVRMDTSPSLKRTTVAITNVALGHATILRIVALLDNSDREAYERSGSTESAANNAGASGGREELKAAQAEPPRPLAQCSEVAVELHDCRVTWKFQPVAAKGYKLPAALHDFLLLHEDIASLDIPRLTINLPLMADAAEHELNGDQTLPGYSTLTFEAGSDGTPSSGSGPTTPGSAASGASPRSSTKAIIAHGLALNAATVGYPGQAALPIVQLPHLSLVHVVAECVNGSGTQLQALQLDVPSFDVGLHPSHLVTAAAAWQLLEHELAHLRRDHADATTDAESIVTSTSTSNQDHLQPSISGSVSASRSEDQEAAAPHPGESPRPPSTGNSPRAPPSAPWQLDIALGVLGLSIVGSMPSSTCLKVEWRGVGCRLSGGAAGGSEHAASGASLAWDDLAVHVMQPKAVMDFMDSMQYPSSFMLGAEGYGSPVAPSLPHSMLRGHGPRSVRRNLSAGLGLAGAADSPQGSVGFQAPPSHFLARFSANSAVSRYFSAADSEFEDAISVSDVHEGAKSPHDGRGAHPALLPLDLSDGDFDVSLLAKLSCSECSNVSDALQPNVTASRRAARTDVSISALALRVFLQGWEPAIECINTYQTFAVRAREHLQRSVKADAADALGSTAAPIAAATPAPTATLPPPVHPPTVHISLRLRDISLEAVAAAGGLPSSAAAAGGEETQVLVPAGCLTFRMESTWAIGASGTRASVMFPGALVSVGCVAAGDVMDTVCMDSRDALFGVRGLQLTASSRPVKEAEQQNTVQKVLRLDVGVQHMSCWANQHNLACMAALVQHVSMVAEHASQLQTVPASAKPATEKASSASLGATAYELTAGVDTLAMLLHSARHSGGPSTCPLFELAVMNLAVAASAHGDGAASANASLMLEVDVYNLRKAAWEPCMDPWTLGLHVSFPMAQGSSSARLSTVQHTRLEVRSAEALELTVTAAVADAAAAANSLLQHVSTVASEPDTLHQHVQEGGGAAGVNAALSATYQLRNLSGAALEVWLAAPQQDGSVPLRPPIGPPELVVDSSTSAALPVLLLHSSESLGRRSGRPSSAVGVIPEDDIDDEVQGVWQEKRQRRTLLFFRFAGQGPLAGPVNLDRADMVTLAVHVGQPTDPNASILSLVAETSEVRPGTFATVLHTGVCIRNTTGIKLEVGVQSPVGMALGDPHLLGVLGPGSSAWLPAPIADSAVLCMRPCCSYRSDSLGQGAWSRPSKSGDEFRRPPTATLGPPGIVYRSTNQLPAQRSSSASLQGQATGHRYEWSAGIPLVQLLPEKQGIPSGAHGPLPRHIACPVAAEENEVPLVLLLAAQPYGEGNMAAQIILAPPLVLHNALPVPLDLTLRPKWTGPKTLHLGPTNQVALLHLEYANLESLMLLPEGYQQTQAIPANSLTIKQGDEVTTHGGSIWKAQGASGGGTSVAPNGGSPQKHPPGAAQSTSMSLTLYEVGPGRSTVDVSLRHTIDPGTGTHILRVACPLWVYNCTGLPIALRSTSQVLEVSGAGPDEGLAAADDQVPDSWVPPLLLPAHDDAEPLGLPRSVSGSPILRGTPQQSPAGRDLSAASVLHGAGSGLRGVVAGRGWGISKTFSDTLPSARSALPGGALSARGSLPPPSAARSSATGSMLSLGRSASVADAPGLQEILESKEEAQPSPGGVLGMQRAASRARGIADSMDTAPTFERPTQWPSMAQGLSTGGPGSTRLHLQVRAAATKAPIGKSYWSAFLDIDASSGGVAVTSLPLPSPATAAAATLGAAHRGAQPVVVTASSVQEADGALALCIAPRYVLRNLLDAPIQYKQQGTGGERELVPGAVCAVRWTDAGLPPRLCVRVQEAGWMWSGGFLLDVPGDLFVKIRHRDRGITMLVRVDVAITDAGIIHVTLSHNPSGFAPYRIENCSLETLNARQRGVSEQQDVLRPYCSLNYAWDEPTLPHALVLELPGSRHVGTFNLDQVGQDVLLSVHTRRGEPERCLRVVVRAEGPTRVLTVLDPTRHTLGLTPAPLPSTSRVRTAAVGSPGPLPIGALPDTAGLWEVSLDLSSVGASLVGAAQELSYCRLSGVDVRVGVSAARSALSVQIRGIQVDNPTPHAAFPIALRLPAPSSKLTSSMAAAVELQPPPALSAQLSVWRRRPAGVLCVEVAEADIASVAVYIDQEHAEEVAAVAAGVLARTHGQAETNSHAPPALVLGDGSARSGGGGTAEGSGPKSPTPHASPAASLQPGVSLPGPHANGLPDLPQLRDLFSLETEGAGAASVAEGASLGLSHQKIYLDLLSLSPVEVTLSFMSSPVHHPAITHPRLAALQRLLSLADVEDVRLWLAGLRLANPLMDAPALAQALQRHYVRALIPELFKVVGAASVFGDPVSLLHHLGLGVWAFVSAPAAGLVESARQRGPRQFLLGLLYGTRGLLQNVIFAVSNAATKASGAARKAIVVWGLDRQDMPLGAGSFRRRLMWEEGGAGPGLGFQDTQGGFLAALLSGAVGLFTDPIRGAEEGGLLGLVRGLQRGALGAVALPLASLLEMSARFADSVRRAVAGSSNVGWLRPPRHVSASEPLTPYDWSQAMGRWLLQGLDRAEAQRAQRRRLPPSASDFVPGEFVLCAPAGARGCYLVLTSRRVLHVRAKGLMWEPVVLWQAEVADLEMVGPGSTAAAVRFVSNPAPKRLELGRRRGGEAKAAHGAALFAFLGVECADSEAATRVRETAHRLMEAVPKRTEPVGLSLVVAPVV